jgi:RHS repeat-associated protein
MKSFPICWNKTLAQLGFRRKIKKSSAKSLYSRRPLFESLETREMLTVAGPVNTLLDVVNANDGMYSLREAINSANASSDVDTITFAQGLTGTITLTAGQLPNISQPLTIDGPGADKLAISGNNANRVFSINSSITVTIEGLTIKDGKTTGSNHGAGIFSAGNLTLDHVNVIGNHAYDTGTGGGLYSSGSVTIIGSTFEDNHANHGGGAFIHTSGSVAVSITNSAFTDNKAVGGSGGGIFIWGAGSTLTSYITNSTFSGNEADTNTGGLRAQGGGTTVITNSTFTKNYAIQEGGLSAYDASFQIHNSIIAGNSDNGSTAMADAAGNISSISSNNLVSSAVPVSLKDANDYITTNPKLAPLGDYGGPTKTHALLPGSPAIDRGSNTYGATTDQRGFARNADDTATANNAEETVDIGAFELPGLRAKADLDGDHREDEIRHDPLTGSLQVTTFPSGQPKVAIWGQLDAVANFLSPQTGDFNGDGRDDLLVKKVSGTWRIAVSDGSQFVIHDTGISGSWSTRFVGDFDNDGSQELLGKLSDGSWDILRYKEGLGASVIDVTGTTPTPTATAYVGDANRDGRDDIIERISDTSWNVSLAQAGSTSFAPAVNWGEWFKAEYVAGNPDFIDASYQRVLDIFSDIYNNYELELYPGLMKGPEATEQTKAGNAWDQAALLVRKLEAALPDLAGDISIVSGKIKVAVDEIQRWLGVETPVAAFRVIDSAIDGNVILRNAAGDVVSEANTDAYINANVTAVEFTHAWVKAKVPNGSGFTVVNLDPSWKFKDRREGIDLGAIGFNSSNAQGIFDEYKYLATDPATDHRLPVEFFEDELMDYLAQHRPGMSLADVPKDGPIIQETFDVFPVGWETGVVTVGNPATYSNFEFILGDDNLKAQLTHRVTLSLGLGKDSPQETIVTLEPDTQLPSYGDIDPGSTPSEPITALPIYASTAEQLVGYEDVIPGLPTGPASTLDVSLSNKTLQPYSPFEFATSQRFSIDGTYSSYPNVHQGLFRVGNGEVNEAGNGIDPAFTLKATNDAPAVAATKQLSSPYQLSANTYLSFNVKIHDFGSLHGLGWMRRDPLSGNFTEKHFFKLSSAGSPSIVSNLGSGEFSTVNLSPANNSQFRITALTGQQAGYYHVEINIGNSSYTSNGAEIGTYLTHLAFFTERNGSNDSAETEFSNISLYNKPSGYTGTITTSGANQLQLNSFATLDSSGKIAKTLQLGNSYTVTSETLLSFDFSSNTTLSGTSPADKFAIGWDNNSQFSGDLSRFFQLAGGATLSGSNQQFRDYLPGNPASPITKSYSIPIGSILGLTSSETTDLTHLVFMMQGAGSSGAPAAESVCTFSNIKLREPGALPAEIVDNQQGQNAIKLMGTQYKTLQLTEPYTIREDSWLLFKFKSGDKGVEHVIGWDIDNTYGNSGNAEHLEKVYGSSSTSTLPDSTYTSFGNDQLMGIPIGRFAGAVNTAITRLVFGVNGGGDEGAESVFSQISFWAPTGSMAINASQVATLHDTAYKSISVNHEITPFTKLEFSFRATSVGRIHGIGIDTDNNSSSALEFYQLLGTDTANNYNRSHYYGSSATDTAYISVTIPIGAFAGEDLRRIILFTDGGPFAPLAHTSFKSIRVFDEIPPSATLIVPDVSLKPITFTTAQSGNNFRSRLYVGAQQLWSTDPVFGTEDQAEIAVEHLTPSKFNISSPSDPKKYLQDFDEIISLGLDANQHSRSSLDLMQSQLIAAMGNNNSESDYVDDIDDLLSYTAAKYWYDFNKSNDIIASLTGTIGTQAWVGSGIATAKKSLLRDPDNTSIFVHDYLPYQIAPVDMGVDLPNAVQDPLDPVTGALNHEVWQLSIFNASAREHNVVEETINSESISTTKGLMRAVFDAGKHVLVLESKVVNDVRTIKHAANLAADASQPNGYSLAPIGQNITGSSYFTNSTNGVLTSYLPVQSTFVNSLYGLLNKPVADGDIRLLIPSDPTSLNLWNGAVYFLEREDLLSFAIKSIDDQQAAGGFSGNKYAPQNFNLPPITFPMATYAGDPVNTANGNMFRDDVDIVFPNLGVPLDFARHYDAGNKDDIGMGVGWTYSFGDVLIADSADTNAGDGQDLIWITSSGQRHKIKASGTTYTLPVELHGSFAFDTTDSKYKYKDKSGLEHHFDNKTSIENGLQVKGRLINVLDNIGNGVKITYQTASNIRRIATVEDVHSSGRRLEFSYETSVTITNPSSSNPSVSGNRIIEIRKYSDGILVDDWDYGYESISGTTANSSQRLTAVVAPEVESINAAGVESPSNPTITYTYFTAGYNKGVIQSITEADGGSHTYEYYPNGRVFRVTDAVGNKQTFSYNLLRNSTEFTDENGNVETYFHQDNGLLVKQVHDDRTRQEFTWGKAGTSAEYLMTSSTDEVGAVETFKYYLSNNTWIDGTAFEHIVAAGDFRDRQLFETTEKHFPNDTTPLVTRFDYFKPGDRQHMVNLSSIIVDPGIAPQNKNIKTQHDYDPVGRLWRTIDPMGNVTTRTFYNGEGGLHEEGLVLTETTARGNDASPAGVDAEAVSWELLREIMISSGTLSVKAIHDNTGFVIADAIKVERIGDEFPYTQIIDDDTDGIANAFHVTGAHTHTTGNSVSYNGDRIALNSIGAAATWTFTNLEQGTYRVTAMWQPNTNRSPSAKFEVVDGIAFSDTQFIGIDQQIAPNDYGPGFKTTFSYDDEGYVTWAKTDNFEPTVSYYYHTGAVDSTTDDAGVRNRYTYDALGRQLSAILDYGNGTPAITSQFAYDKSGRLRISIDPLGRETEFVYDLKGKLTKQINADGTFVEFDYDGFGNRVSQIDELGRETKFRYDSRNRLIETIYCDGTSTRLEYNGVGQISASIDTPSSENEPGRRTSFTYDAAGRLLATKNALDKTATNEYDHVGRLVKAFDFNQNRTELKHDKLGRVIESRTIAFGGAAILSLTTTDYDANGNITRVVQYDAPALNYLPSNATDPRALITNQNKIDNKLQITEFQYDALDRPIVTVNADGTSTRTVYDNSGRVLYQLDELNRRTKFEYDSYGRLWKTIAPDPDGNPATNNTPLTTRTYDAAGNLVKTIDPNGNPTTFTYDLRNRLVGVTDALGGQQHTLYDIAGQIVATVDALGRVAFTLRDKRGRAVLSREADPDGAGPQTAPETRFEYYKNGNLKSKTDALGNVTEYVYDELNRLKKETRFLPPEVHILDNTSQPVATGSPGFSIFRSSGSTGSTTGYEGDATIVHPVTSGNFDAVADWKFVGLSPGTYRAYTTWDQQTGVTNVTNDLFLARIYDAAGNQVSSYSQSQINGDQTAAPIGEIRVENGVARTWVPISANFTLAGTGEQAATVRIWSLDDMKLIADAVRLERVDAVPSVERTYTYDDNGNLLTETDTLDRTTTYSYDGLNRRIKVTTPDPDGAGPNVALVTDTTYDGFGNVKKTIEQRGGQPRETQFTYDPRNRLLTQTQAALSSVASTTKFSYDTVGNLTQKIEDYSANPVDRINAKTEYVYDALNRQTVVKRYRSDGDSLPLLTTTTYDAIGNVESTTESVRQDLNGTLREQKITTTFTYDALNRLASSTEHDGVVWQQLTDNFNVTNGTLSVKLSNTTPNKVVIADAIRIERLGPNGEILETRIIDDDKTLSDPRFTAGPGPLYDSSTQLQTEYGGDTTFTGPINTVAARFAIWTFTGLASGTYRVSATWVRDPAHCDPSAKYELFNGAVDASPDDTRFANHADYPVGIIGATSTFTYDAVGNLIAETNPLGQTSTSEYDRLNRLVKSSSPDPDGNPTTNNTPHTTYSYDPLGQLVATTNGEGEIETFAYDTFGNVVRSEDGLGHATLSTYDSEGNLLTYTDPEGNKTTYAYDAWNRLKTDTITLAGLPATRTYTYNNQGNLSEKIDRVGRKTTYTYDVLDRKTYERHWDSSGQIAFMQWQYDNLGRTKLAYDVTLTGGTVIATDYDDLGRVISERNYDASITTTAPKVEQRYEYEQFVSSDWQHSFQTYSQYAMDGPVPELIGTTKTFIDPMGRVARIEDTPAGQATKKVEYTYDAASRVIDVTRTAGSFFFDTRYQYDLAGRLTQIGHYRDDDVTPFTSYGYEYDRADRITELTTTHATGIAAVDGTEVEDFTFDLAGQLTGNDSSASGQDESFTYDANGNRKTVDGQNVLTDPHNRLKEDADYTYLYDKEGNRIRKTAKVGGGYTVYTWDHRNRLISVVDHENGGTITNALDYAYNIDDMLASRAKYYYDDGEVEEVFTSHFTYDGNDLVLDLDPEMGQRHRYLWADAVDMLLADKDYWAATDHLGSVNDLLDSSEAIVEHREYDSFGAIDQVFNSAGQSTGTTLTRTNIGHAGSLWDQDAQFYRKGNRPYDPGTSQFLTTDFGGFIDGPNLYWYAHNNPIIYFDPSGFSAIKPLDNLLRGGSVSIPTQFTDYGLRVGARPLGNLGIDTSFGPTVNLAQTLGRLNGNRTLQGYEAQINSLSRERTNLNAQLADARASLANRSFYEVFDKSADRARINSLTDQLQTVIGRRSVARDNYWSAENAILNGDPRQTFSYRSTEYASVGKAFNSGLETGHKAVINGIASGAVSFGTLGFVDYQGPARVTRQDIYNGYETAFAVSRLTTEFVGGAALGGIASAGKFGRLGTAALAYDTAGNAVGAGRGLVNAYNNGLTVGNSVQIVGGALGLAGNVATGSRVLGDIASDAGRLRVQPAGLYGGVPIPKVSVAPKGGTYLLVDADGIVRRTGRTFDLQTRQYRHSIAPSTKDLFFKVDKLSDNYAALRGREQIIHDLYPSALIENGGLNKIRGIRPDHPSRDVYLDAGRKL